MNEVSAPNIEVAPLEPAPRRISQVSTGGGLRLGCPITEFLSAGARYSLVHDELTLDEDRFFSDVNQDADIVDLQCSPAKAGRYLCDEIGERLTSTLGYSVVFDNRNGIRATRGQRVTLSQDFAGLGGDTKFIRTRFEGTKYFRLPKDFVLSVHGQGGYIHPLQSAPGEGRDAVRLTDRFFGAQMRGFDIRGIGPRIIRQPYDLTGALLDDETGNDAIGGRAFYMGRLELEIPVSANIRSLGLRPSAFIDAGSVFSISKPNLDNFLAVCTPNPPGLDVVFIRPGDASTSCPADIAAPPYIRLEDNLTWWTLGGTIAVPADAQWQLGLSAVIEERDGAKSFWAMAHPEGAPDFHHRSCFAATLSPIA